MISGTATGIKNYSTEGTKLISINRAVNPFIPKTDITIDLKKKLFDLMKKKSDKVDIAFYGKSAIMIDSLVFKDVSSVAESGKNTQKKKVKKEKIIQFSVFQFSVS